MADRFGDHLKTLDSEMKNSLGILYIEESAKCVNVKKIRKESFIYEIS